MSLEIGCKIKKYYVKHGVTIFYSKCDDAYW